MTEQKKSQSEIVKMLQRIIENPPAPNPYCACGLLDTECDADPAGVAGCDRRQKERVRA